MKNFVTWLLIVLLVMNLIPAVSPIVKASYSTWYVSPIGNDNNAGDILHPFKTLRKAIDASSNGDTIYMRGGNYNSIRSASTGIAIDRSGVSNAQPFTIMSYPGETAILNGNGYSFTRAYGILSIGTLNVHQNNITIKNLRFENSSQNAISAYSTTSTGSCHDIQILNCSFYNINERAILMYAEGTSTTNPFTNIKVSDCTFEKIQNIASMGEAVTFEYCKNFEISYNMFTDIRKIFIDVASGSSWGEIHHNSCQMNNTHSGEAIYIDSSSYNGKTCSYIRIHNNTIWGLTDSGSQNYGIAVCAEVAGGIVHNITIENNIINRSASTRSGNYPYGIGVKGVNKIRDITIKHNTIYIAGGTAGPYCACFYATARNALRVKVANNIFIHKGTNYPCVKIQNYDSTNTNFMLYNNLYNRLDGSTWTTWFPDTINITETKAVIDNPECVGVSTGDFHLNSTSPAIDAANSNYIVSTDHDGHPRPQNGLPDIGAYEYYLDTESPPEITNVKITPDIQLSGESLNISWSITDNEGAVDDGWVTITYPDDTTKSFPMQAKYYLTQTYSQIGTYHFFIEVIDANRNSNKSKEYMFQIIPVLTNAFLVGIISDDYDSSESIITIKPQLVFSIELTSFNFHILSSSEKIYISENYVGYLNSKFIIGMFNAAVLSENNTNTLHNHQILNYLNRDVQHH